MRTHISSCGFCARTAWSHLQHVADVENGAVLSGVHVRRDVTVFVLDRHAPAGKLHHLASVGPVEIKQRSLLQGSLKRGSRSQSEKQTFDIYGDEKSHRWNLIQK